MKWKSNWKKALRNGICVGTLALFVFQFSAMAQEGDSGSQEDLSKISPLLMEAFAQQPAPMSLDAQTSAQTVPAAVWITDTDLSEASATAASSSGLLSTAPLAAPLSSVEAAATMPVSNAPTNAENPDAVQDYIEAKRLAARTLYAEQNEAFAAAHFDQGDILYVSQYSPLILVNVTLDEAYDLTRYDEVSYLDHYQSGADLQLTNAVSASHADYVRDTKNYKGGGIKVGILDGHISSTAGLPSSITVKPENINDYEKCMHAKRVAKVIMTMAPNATYYAACADNYIANTEWLLSQGVNVINISAELGHTMYARNTYSFVSYWLDHVVFHHDVHLVVTSGNYGSGGVNSSGMAYNAITVGAYNDQNGTNPSNFTVADFSSYIPSRTGEVASKPDILAPGENILISVDGSTVNANGTSFAAPIVTGTVVYMCQVNSTIKLQPESAKAALAASCFDVHYTPEESGYQRWGNGALNSRYAWVVARDSQFRSNYTTFNGPRSYTYTFSTSSASTYEFVALTTQCYSVFYANDVHTGTPDHDAYPPTFRLEIYNNSTNALVASQVMAGFGWNMAKVGFPTGGANTFRIELTQLNDFTRNGYFGVAWY